MADSINALITEAKKSKYSLVPHLTEDDYLRVWNTVSAMVLHQMLQTKGLTITGFGTFTFSQRIVNVGKPKPLILQRPVLQLSENLIQTHSLQYSRQHASGHIPVTPLNFTVLGNDTGLDRETVISCLQELFRAFSRRLKSGTNVNLDFYGVGRLAIREKKARMKFFKEFIEAMDDSGIMKATFKSGSRPGSNGSIMSAPSIISIRPSTTASTLRLPRIAEVSEGEELSLGNQSSGHGPEHRFNEDSKDDRAVTATKDPFRSTINTRPGTPFHTPKTVSAISVVKPLSAQQPRRPAAGPLKPLPPLSLNRPGSCAHSSKCQDMCYVCHQRAINNVAISVTEEKEAKEKMQEKLLQDFIEQRHRMELAREQTTKLENKKYEGEIAKFNMEKTEKKIRDKEIQTKNAHFQPSYIFQNRSNTPCFTKKQMQYCKQLDEQVKRRRQALRMEKEDEENTDRKEQEMLRKELELIHTAHAKESQERKLNYLQALNDQVITKSQRVDPPDPPLSCQPVFGVVQSQKALTDKQRAKELFDEQLSDSIRKRKDHETQVKKTREDEAKQLQMNKIDLMSDLKVSRKERIKARQELEQSWLKAAQAKTKSDTDSKEHDGRYILLQEQCSKYLRCKQCQRKRGNKGASNIMAESRYLGGSRLMV